jgi:hypothetical protein
MTRYAALVIMLAMSACAPQVPNVSAARQQFERKHQTNLAPWHAQDPGPRMAMFGVNHYELVVRSHP